MAVATNLKKPVCFIVMPFQEPFDGYFKEIIRPAGERAGFFVKSARDIMTGGVLMHEVANDIEDATVIITDLTGGNCNAFYSLGLAHAWNKPVVMLAQSVDNVPSNLQSLPWVCYSAVSPASLEKLSAGIFNALIAIERGNRKTYLVPSIDPAMSMGTGDLLNKLNQISGNQKKLLEFIRNIEKPMEQDAIERHFPEFNGKELFYRLEKLRLQGFLVSHDEACTSADEDFYTFELSSAARNICG
jgi:hypothetical protein